MDDQLHAKGLRKYIRILKTREMPIWFLISRVLWRSRACLLFKIRRNGYVLRFRPSSFSAELWLCPDAHKDEEQLFARYLRGGDCMLDVGANIGLLTLAAAARVGPEGSVYAFEPHPRIFRYLERNLKLNGCSNVQSFNLALGEVEGHVLFSNHRTDDQNAIIPRGQGIKVQVRPLDALDLPEPVIHLLKVDTEGYENFVFRGGLGVLKRTLVVYFECWDKTRYGYHPREILQLLQEAGFHIFRLRGDALSRVEQESFSIDGVENLLAVKEPQQFLSRTRFAEGGISSNDLRLGKCEARVAESAPDMHQPEHR
jgi:FkbM family methyltransferase